MSKKPGKIDLNLPMVTKFVQTTVFMPDPVQRAAKIAFWNRYQEDSVNGPTLELALKLTGQAQLKKWWQLPGFEDWFSNRDEQKERLEYLYELGLDSIESLFLDPSANPTARVAAFKAIATIAGKTPDSKSSEFADAEIQKINDKDKLLELIRKKSARILELNPSKDEDKENE